MDERTQRLGQRAELRQERGRLVPELAALRDQLRLKLDPVAEVAELPGEEIATLAAALAGRQSRLRELDAKLATLARILGQ